MSDGGKGVEIFPQAKTRDTVASKLGIGSGKQYEKEKYIADNKDSLTPENFADWDEGKLSIKEIKDLIESNLRQRVLGNTNPMKLGRCFDF